MRRESVEIQQIKRRSGRKTQKEEVNPKIGEKHTQSNLKFFFYFVFVFLIFTLC